MEIGPAFLATEPPPKTIAFKAVWDTGASASVITQKVVDALGLKPITRTMVHHAHGATDAEVYLVAMRFPRSIGFRTLRVTKGDLWGMDALVGMDIISQGDLVITNLGGQTELSYHHPSIGLDALNRAIQKAGPLPSPSATAPPATISPTALPPTARQAKPTPVLDPFPGVSRSAPCPCGSGKKYKRCCGVSAPPRLGSAAH